MLHHAVGPLHREGNLRYEAHVHGPRRQRRVHGDEAGLAAHELDDSHAVERGLGLHGSRLDGLLRLLHGGVEAECFIDVEDVVVDRLRDADDGNLEAAAGALGADRVGPSVAPVTADHEHHVDPLPLDGIDDLRDVAAAAAATHDGTAPVLYTKHDVSSLTNYPHDEQNKRTCTPLVLRLVSGMFVAPSRQNPPHPNLIPEMFFTPYPTSRVFTTDLTTSLIPGQSPPQFTMAAWTSPGSK